jgi:hypothetical protein
VEAESKVGAKTSLNSGGNGYRERSHGQLDVIRGEYSQADQR